MLFSRVVIVVSKRLNLATRSYCRTSVLSVSGHLYRKPLRYATYARPLSIHTALYSQASKKIEPFILPDIGEGINEVVIRDWLVKVGDTVKEFDGICDVESDKATATISSRYNGVITKLHYDVGAMAKVGKPLVDIEIISDGQEEPVNQILNSDVSNTDISGIERPSSRVQPSQDLSQENNILTLPSVRRLAKEHDIDLSKVTATGKHGRIVKEDILSYLEQLESSRNMSQQLESTRTLSTELKPDTVVQLTGMQKAMYRTMTQSLKIPHFNYADDIDMTHLVEFSRGSNEMAQEPSDKISNFAIIVKMASLALQHYPQLNASVDEEGQHLTMKHSHNIGIAVDTRAGLVVPNIKNVQNLSIKAINLELQRLRKLGYTSKLGPSDLSGGTFTLSNIGAIGGVFGVPVIVSPEIVIGALGRTQRLPRFSSTGSIEERHIMRIVWSADHRVVDGATLSRFSNLLKLYLEQPNKALLELV